MPQLIKKIFICQLKIHDIYRMKTVILSSVLLINSILSSFSQRNSGIDNSYLTLVSATMENQITGANSENSSRMIYNINLEAKSAFGIKKISGKINEVNLKGNIIYNNTISDSVITQSGKFFTIRFEKYEMEPGSKKCSGSKISGNQKCYRNKKNNTDNTLIFLTYFIENKQFKFRVKCSNKIISHERQLPQ